MGTLYTVPFSVDPPLPDHLVTRVVVMRADGGVLTEDDISAAQSAFPSPPVDEAVIMQPTRKVPALSKEAEAKLLGDRLKSVRNPLLR